MTEQELAAIEAEVQRDPTLQGAEVDRYLALVAEVRRLRGLIGAWGRDVQDVAPTLGEGLHRTSATDWLAAEAAEILAMQEVAFGVITEKAEQREALGDA